MAKKRRAQYPVFVPQPAIVGGFSVCIDFKDLDGFEPAQVRAILDGIALVLAAQNGQQPNK